MSVSLIVLEPRARRELDKVPPDAFRKIDQAIRGLVQRPRPLGVKKLDGNLHRIRVGPWRIIYAILDREQKIVVLRIARRSEKTYRNIN